MDDWSTDNSTSLAHLLGVRVVRFGWKVKQQVFPTPNITEFGGHNVVWRRIVAPGTWVITVDMDELLCLSQEQLLQLYQTRRAMLCQLLTIP